MTNALAVKGELVLAVQLVTRHRAPRLTALLGLGLAVLAAASKPRPDLGARMVVLVAGMLAAVSASRLLASGPAYAAARMVVAPSWLVPVGRLTGVLCLVGPVAMGVALALALAAPQGVPVLMPVAVALVYAACVAVCTMAMAPACGASGAALLGFLAAFVGIAPPSGIGALLAAWPPLQWLVVWLWNALPLPWRAMRWLASGGWEDALLLVTWTLMGLGVVCLQVGMPRPPRRPDS